MSAADEDNWRAVSSHYGRVDLGTAILDAVKDAGGDPEHLTIEDLAPFDHLHSGNHAATLALIRLADLPSGARVLDVGGGIGGPARTLARDVGCRVTVLDATQAFCEVGAMLTARTGFSDRVTFEHGSALDMPFPGGHFDAVWMQNVGMNIENKAQLFAEIARVLRRGGRLVMQEVLAGAAQPAYYPAVWASQAEQSFLVTTEELRGALSTAGLRELVWQEWVAPPPNSGVTPVPILALMLYGEDGMRLVAENTRRNLAEGRIRPMMAVAERQ